MPDHKLSKLYLLAPSMYEEQQQKPASVVKNCQQRTRKTPTTNKIKAKKQDSINQWNERNRKLQMKLLAKLKKSREINENYVNKNVSSESQNISQLEAIPLRIPSPTPQQRNTRLQSESPSPPPRVSNKLESSIIGTTNVVPGTNTPRQSRSKNQETRAYYGFIPGNSKKLLVARTPNQKGKGKGFNWITID